MKRISCLKLPTKLHRNVKAQALEPSVFRTWITILAIRADIRRFPSVERIASVTKQAPSEIESHISLLIQQGLFAIDAKGKVRPLPL